MSNYTFGKLIVTKKEFANILLLANVFFGVGTLRRHIPSEGG